MDLSFIPFRPTDTQTLTWLGNEKILVFWGCGDLVAENELLSGGGGGGVK